MEESKERWDQNWDAKLGSKFAYYQEDQQGPTDSESTSDSSDSISRSDSDSGSDTSSLWCFSISSSPYLIGSNGAEPRLYRLSSAAS
ncbi:hypothetical protein QCA50_017907 [Cerrena zonata]|uniref:Uncharacterized protein n=1 Tax=Cerrena zonata TaxID=2478898 RepID=A0AAW0FJE2_9APHY